MCLVIGDWSDDGHCMSDEVKVRVNRTVLEVQETYKKACLVTGVEFNHNEDFTDRSRDWKKRRLFQVCTSYQDSLSHMTPQVMDALEEHGIDRQFLNDIKQGGYIVEFVKLWFRFCQIVDPALEWNEDFSTQQEGTAPTPVINGYWNPNLNVQFGYGLYD
jgi:hypothetical protein